MIVIPHDILLNIFFLIIFVYYRVRSGTNSKVHSVHTARHVMGFVDGWWWDVQQVVDTGSRTTG